MPGTQGKPTPPRVEAFIVDTARDNPQLTNSEIELITKKKFGWSPDHSTVGRFRRDAGIPNSRTARIQISTRSTLTSDQSAYVDRLLNKLVLPDPDFLNASEVVRERGVGMVGTRDVKIHIRIVDSKLTKCWLAEKELNVLIGVVANMSDDLNFKKLHRDGTEIIGDILSHNRHIEFGSGDPSFSEVSQLLETRSHEHLPEFAKPVHRLWSRYAAFGKELESFKQQVSDSLIPEFGE